VVDPPVDCNVLPPPFPTRVSPLPLAVSVPLPPPAIAVSPLPASSTEVIPISVSLACEPFTVALFAARFTVTELAVNSAVVAPDPAISVLPLVPPSINVEAPLPPVRVSPLPVTRTEEMPTKVSAVPDPFIDARPVDRFTVTAFCVYSTTWAVPRDCRVLPPPFPTSVSPLPLAANVPDPDPAIAVSPLPARITDPMPMSVSLEFDPATEALPVARFTVTEFAVYSATVGPEPAISASPPVPLLISVDGPLPPISVSPLPLAHSVLALPPLSTVSLAPETALSLIPISTSAMPDLFTEAVPAARLTVRLLAA
jgi:hypothetical protein